MVNAVRIAGAVRFISVCRYKYRFPSIVSLPVGLTMAVTSQVGIRPGPGCDVVQCLFLRCHGLQSL